MTPPHPWRPPRGPPAAVGSPPESLCVFCVCVSPLPSPQDPARPGRFIGTSGRRRGPPTATPSKGGDIFGGLFGGGGEWMLEFLGRGGVDVGVLFGGFWMLWGLFWGGSGCWGCFGEVEWGMGCRGGARADVWVPLGVGCWGGSFGVGGEGTGCWGAFGWGSESGGTILEGGSGAWGPRGEDGGVIGVQGGLLGSGGAIGVFEG